MLVEKGEIVEVEDSALVVQVIQQSTCGSCAAQKGCGQGVLAKYLTGSHLIRVALKHRSGSDFSVGEEVELGIEEFAMLRAAFLVYLVPLVTMIFGAVIGRFYSEPLSLFGALLGLLSGGIYVYRQSQKKKDDPAYSPVIIDDRSILRILPSQPA